MNDAEQYLLRVLRGFVQGEDPGAFSGDWKQLLELAAMHSVTGILGHSVMSFPHPDSAPFAQAMRRQCLQTMALFSQRAEAMAQLTHALSAEGIDHLLFKGYVVRDYYPIPELRTFGDIDFLIRPEDRAKSDAYMKAQGFEPKENWEPGFSYIRGAEFYEIHSHVLETDISERADYRAYFSHDRNTIFFTCSRTLPSTSTARAPARACIWTLRFSCGTSAVRWTGHGSGASWRS